VVADFEGRRAGKFALLVQVFLAAWMEHTGASRTWPVHVAAIGDLPRPVTRMARAAGAQVVRCAPLVINTKRTSNKLRGLEVDHQTEHIVLLDADTLVLRDLTPLLAITREAIGVSSSTANHFPEPTWRRVFDAVGVSYPGATGTCWCQDPRIASARGLDAERRALVSVSPPYFNSGVVVAPVAAGLAPRWRDHLARIAPLFSGSSPLPYWGQAGLGDEHALATALESLRREGVGVVEIPKTFHARPVLLRAGVHTWRELAILHYPALLKPYVSSVEELGTLLYGRVWRALRERLAAGVGLRAIRSPVYRRVLARDVDMAEEFYRYIHHLYRVHLRHVGR
jgi:hypothetical protein